MRLYNPFWVLQTEVQKWTRSPLKTSTGIPRCPKFHYPDPGAWMFLTSVQISPSHSALGNHSLKFRNQIDLDHMLVPCYPNSYYLTHSVNSVYRIWLVFWALSMLYVPVIEWHSHLEGYTSSISFCVLFWKKLLHLCLNQAGCACAQSLDLL